MHAHREGTLLALVLACLLAVAASASESLRLNPPVAGCPVCELWLEYEDVVLLADQEVAKIEDGVLYFYHSDDPSVIEPLIRFAYERQALAVAIRTDPGIQERLGRPCTHTSLLGTSTRLEITTSARGVVAILRSSNAATVGVLKAQAKRALRSKYPLWF